ncbi:MAG: bifunctional DNA primase/polymerase [Minisyncoccia bacterium]
MADETRQDGERTSEAGSMLHAALEYLQLGYPVFPVQSGSKMPLIKWGEFQKRKPTEQEVRQWWVRWPDASIGFATGAISGIVVIDIEKDGSAEGFPPTVTVRTGGDGLHLHYKHPGLPVQNSTKKIAPLTDVRGDGGYALLPPSLHKSGKRYEWIVQPTDADLAPLPSWVLEKAKVDTGKKTDWGQFSHQPVGEGERNDAATKYAGKLLHDLSPEMWATAGWDALREWNRKSCEPSLDEKELRAVFDSIAGRQSTSHSKTQTRQKPSGSESSSTPNLRRMSDVQPEDVSWLWPQRIPSGKLTVIAGDPDLGKSSVAYTIAAHISRGTPWPVNDGPAPIGDSILLSAEDGAADTIRPRLDAAGADCNRVFILESVQDIDADGKPIKRFFSLNKDIAALDKALSSLPNCKLLIIDPISAYLDGVNTNSNSEVRGVMMPFTELATRHNVAIIAISHFNKSGMGKAMYRIQGSLAFVAAARVAYTVVADTDDKERRLFIPIKNNLIKSKDRTGLAYKIVDNGNNQPLIIWEDKPIDITADEALSLSSPDTEAADTDWAELFLQDLLAEGPILATEVSKAAKAANITPKQLRRVQLKLKVEHIKDKKTLNGPWWWVWPGHEDALKLEDALSKTEGTLGMEGHLRVDTDDTAANYE